ncbi:uncharacterized protein LOC129766803 [Toxorhynchites rutilus septentrionalis]|uniref:uncharacterized protein LOC129766803 n=1 Tax=Toxorhynchites rutilus septentrionalis TaxID=329112 RepID=UPI002479007E|nr:uncharacterized protein LOC129766803 [Toxorhynchites rutilus septentrionalis]
MNLCVTTNIQDQLTKFWELETCRTNSTNSVEESACETIFEQTTCRDTTGRFVVTLPKKPLIIEQLGESRTTAMRRFMGLERRLHANPELRNAYTDFIHEYQLLGHMKEVAVQTTKTVYYLPHHAVMKPESTTTKLRVVFDASCLTTTGVSLNDALMIGPVIQEDLINIIVRFCLHRYAVVADIAKMYRMIRVQPDDGALQRILWRDSPTDDIRTYELTTVTYGTACAPYLATKCLQQLADISEETHPTAAKILRRDFYMDDLLSGVDQIPQGKMVVSELINLLDSAGFPLRKWSSNCSEILSDIPEHLHDDRSHLQLDSSNSVIKTLGLVWELSTDTFQFSTPKWASATFITKRSVLSDVSRLFDPLGLVGPVIVQAKIFIQELWKQQCGWDEPLPAELQDQWQ